MTIVDIPGSKSLTARALFLAAAAEGTSTLLRPLHSDDTEGFTEGLAALGYRVEHAPGRWLVEGRPAGPLREVADVYCRDGATTARFLPTLVAAGHGNYRFDASDQMRRRPVAPLTRALRALGVDVRHEQAEGHHPLSIAADGVKGGELTLDAGESSQYLTALLMLGPLTREGLRITVTRLVSAPYVEITLAMMAAFGATVDRGPSPDGEVFDVRPGGYRAAEYAIEPDASTASYFFAAAALTGREVTVPGLGRGALQGDLQFVEVLRRMGAGVRVGDAGTTVSGTGKLRGITVNMRDISDTMPTLAALAPFADGPVRIEDVGNTRVKECDRLEACAENLRAMGVEVATGPDWIEIVPGAVRPVEIATRHDHRIAMSFAVASLRAPGITFDDPGCVRKTFPGFHEAFAALRAGWEGRVAEVPAAADLA
ncbi:3-phosphoshikimate 1-carboxyvinyltransferase [Streptomyces sp. NBC_00335]|uniref:3-phosphoshikimate 1-carboxyvinyltransferase n=1 Tax=unclassified Streptomyces TaxID=2593676 RepID=UPI00224EC1DE|nr:MULTISPECIES: 3-phosphoshikimate 1-carboxyvinyltransferase [unclassified Streptomyces]MCX5409272.1 3-phosphoshikimate 1-carboxyvinyltransferase [Streptomyces sp. NBC_00086]